MLVEFILSFSCLPSLRLNTVCACGFRRWSSCCLRGAPTLTRPKRYVCDCARVCVYVCCCFCALVAARAQPGPHSVKARASWTGGSLVLPVAPVAGEVFDDVFHFLLVRPGMRVLLVMCGKAGSDGGCRSPPTCISKICIDDLVLPKGKIILKKIEVCYFYTGIYWDIQAYPDMF